MYQKIVLLIKITFEKVIVELAGNHIFISLAQSISAVMPYILVNLMTMLFPQWSTNMIVVVFSQLATVLSL